MKEIDDVGDGITVISSKIRENKGPNKKIIIINKLQLYMFNEWNSEDSRKINEMKKRKLRVTPSFILMIKCY